MYGKDLESTPHNRWMQLALKLAKKGEGKVNPNPLVGAVVVKYGKLIGKGFHECFGGDHAEVNALNSCSEDPAGADIYVTLEPCNHYGKTPPCSEMIVKKKLSRCFIASSDKSDIASGGANFLNKNGVEAYFLDDESLVKEARELNQVFFKFSKTKTPFVFAKCATTLDGKIATRNYHSQWISSLEARKKGHFFRKKFMGILVGAGTILADNPQLTYRTDTEYKASSKNLLYDFSPFRIILDPHSKITKSHKIIANNADKKTIIITHEPKNNDSENYTKIEELRSTFNIDFIFLQQKNSKVDHEHSFSWHNILKELGKKNIDSLLIEGGRSVLSSAFRKGVIDAGEIFVSPKIIGDNNAPNWIDGFSPLSMKDIIELTNVKINQYENTVGFSFQSNHY